MRRIVDLRTRWPYAILLTLAACGGGEEGANNAAAGEATTASEPVTDNATDDVGNGLVVLPPALISQPTVATTFPADYHGRWGMVANDCEPGRGDAKGLMMVAADALRFYESRAVPTQIEIASPFKLTAQMAFIGEGQRWTKRQTLTLIESGQTLVREESGPAASYRYRRCPG